MKPVWVSLELILDSFEWSHIVLFLLGALGCWACSLLYFTCLLHEFVEHVVFEYRVVQELEIFKIFYCVLLAWTTDRLRKKPSCVPRHLQLAIATINCLFACLWSSSWLLTEAQKHLSLLLHSFCEVNFAKRCGQLSIRSAFVGPQFILLFSIRLILLANRGAQQIRLELKVIITNLTFLFVHCSFFCTQKSVRGRHVMWQSCWSSKAYIVFGHLWRLALKTDFDFEYN